MNPATHLDRPYPAVPDEEVVADSPRAPTQGAQLATHMLGHYARPTWGGVAGDGPGALALLAALVAIETSARLGRYLPISVGTRHLRALQPQDFGAATAALAGAQSLHTAYWSQWDEAQVRHRAAREALPLLAAARSTQVPRQSLAVELTDQQIEISATQEGAPVRILCRIGNGTLLVTALCDKDDPWAQACGAVAEMYAEILHELLVDPTVVPSQANGISAASRAWVLGDLSGRAHHHGDFVAIPQMLERRADAHPHRIAYRFGERTLSYGQFDGLANALAEQLAGTGVARGQVVAVLLANSLEMPVAYQALMKLGAAFVPLDPAWPAQRLAQTLEVLGGNTVVCADPAAVPEAFRARALAVRIDALAPQAGTGRPGVLPEPEDAIYGIFTSGTTGRPKCAMNNHRGLANRFRFMSRYFHGGVGVERILQNSKHTFDSSVWQLFWPLTTGGEVVIPQQGAFLDLEATIDTIARHGVAMTDFVPSVFNQVVALAERHADIRAKLATLRELVVGGEEITPQMVHKLRAILPQLRVSNAYGPTETSIGMVFHPVETADGAEIPLGRPIDNCHIVVVDDDLRPLPQGAIGEMLIGGACVGNGYLNDPDRTAQVFIANPFPSIPGKTLYRSGDLGYFDPQGRLRFVGRRDFQVKVGGVRIELGEVEAAAERHPQVHHAKALVAAGDDGARFLALFATGTAQLDEPGLLAHLRATLVRNSLPRHVFVLPGMPLTDNAKVDRKQLQAILDAHLDAHAPTADAQATVPGPSAASGEPLPEQILGVLRARLERPALQADDDFFEAGGDSLQALATTMALGNLCGVRLGVKDLFEGPTARQLCSRIRALQQAGQSGLPGEPDDLALMERDAALAASVPLPPVSALMPSAAPRSVFVTGATGFVGGYLVHELLRRRGTEVHALCRYDGDAQQGLERSLAARGLWDASFKGRLHAVRGDLRSPRLGLDDASWQLQAAQCDAILHCGALVNFLYDYPAHRAANVLGTLELLRLARQGRAKPFHFISTLGVLDKEAALRDDPLSEQFDPALAVAPSSGYSRSKWVAERLLQAARAQGTSVTVYRLGEVMPSAGHGLPNPRALTHFLLSAMVQLGAVPDVPICSDWSPASYVARRVAAALFDPGTWNRAYHVIHPQTVSFTDALAQAGMSLERLSCSRWLARLVERAAGPAPVPRELTLLRGLLAGLGGDEGQLARAFAGLLTNNPRLFGRDGCQAIEQAHALHDGDLDTAIAAYARTLRSAPPVRDEHNNDGLLSRTDS